MMNYITHRAISLTKYLIKEGLDPYDAVHIAISKYIKNPKLDIEKLIKAIKKELKQDFIIEEDEV